MEKLRNLGPVSQSWLQAVGITSRAQLRRFGPVNAFLRVQQAGYRPSLNLLWALAGAVRDVDWRDLAKVEKDRLRDELRNLSEG